MGRRPILWMLIGVPGSGKSTWIETHFGNAADHLHVASTDAYIEEVAWNNQKTYNEVFKDNIKAAEKSMYEYIIETVKNDHDLVWDQTNMSRKSRAKKLVMIPDHYEKIAVVFQTPEEEELKRRLASRPGKTIPWGVMDTMIKCFNYPELDEGFDKVLYVDNGVTV